VESTDQPYPFTEVQTDQPAYQAAPVYAASPRESELSARRIVLHISLFLITVVTTTLTGAASAVKIVEPESVLGQLFAPIAAVFQETAAGNFDPVLQGLIFSFTLLVILGAHEFGHYFACRYYGVRATLPFFLPAPPVISFLGTFGAVIKIKAPIRSRRALFDIGIAGPLAGFAFALPASVVGLLMAKAVMPSAEATSKVTSLFQDPLLFKLIIKLFHTPDFFDWNPVYWAAWGTLLVTALNLFPVGQLDGGHVVYAVLGPRAHKWISRMVCVAVPVLSVAAFYLNQPPIYLLWTFMLLFLLYVGHPPVMTSEPLGKGRIALAILALLVFILCFMPFPITNLSAAP
jgi:membrane-associated protease RseP (regulator of RpoE activity)